MPRVIYRLLEDENEEKDVSKSCLSMNERKAEIIAKFRLSEEELAEIDNDLDFYVQV